MLRKAIESYLDNLRQERHLDRPFLALLAAMGFKDIHFTHGISEFGKDVIGKKLHDGDDVFQYVFQLKAGNIGTPDWRPVREQLFEAATNGISHPAFDADAPRVVVLVTNGRLVGNAPVDAQEFRKLLTQKLGVTKFEVWGREQLVDSFIEFGPEHIYSRKPEDYASYGAFFARYGDALSGQLSERAVESYSERWATLEAPVEQKAIIAALESSTLASACKDSGSDYVAVHVVLAALRALLVEAHRSSLTPQREIPSFLREAITSILNEIRLTASECLNAACEALAHGDGTLLDSMSGSGLFVTYPVQCLRLVECLAIQYLLGNPNDRAMAANRLEQLINTEPGCMHPISDWYTISVVAAAIVLSHAGRESFAREYCKNVAVWVIDRYANNGFGLARVDSTEQDEVRQLLGEPFSGIKIRRQDGSLLITALIDLACYLQDESLYEGLVHDTWACDIIPRYFQPRDSAGLYFVGGDDVIQLPNIEFAENMPPFQSLVHGEHLDGELRGFSIEEVAGPVVLPLLAIFLRDRYFPATWARWVTP